MSDAALVLDDVRIALAGRELLRLSLAVEPGTVATVMGPSGSGKSSLLALIAGFLDPAFRASGGVRLDGIDLLALPAHRRRVGLMFQDDLLFPHMSVAGNLLFALPPVVTGRAARHAAAEAALAEVGLDGFGERDPATLSGGQRARVALARTLLAEPRALLLDEPFSRLDRALRGQVRDLVLERARRRGLPTLLVTHDEEDAAAAAGAVVTIG
mgnify:CR=1 FL=1